MRILYDLSGIKQQCEAMDSALELLEEVCSSTQLSKEEGVASELASIELEIDETKRNLKTLFENTQQLLKTAADSMEKADQLAALSFQEGKT